MGGTDDLVHNFDEASVIAHKSGRRSSAGLRNIKVLISILLLISFLLLYRTKVFLIVIDLIKSQLVVAQRSEEAKDRDAVHTHLDVKTAHNLTKSDERLAAVMTNEEDVQS